MHSTVPTVELTVPITYTSPLIDNSYRIYRSITCCLRQHRFQGVFKFLHLSKKVSNQKGGMLDGTKTPKRWQNLSNKIAKASIGQWAWSYTKKTSNCSKGRRMHSAWTINHTYSEDIWVHILLADVVYPIHEHVHNLHVPYYYNVL